MDNHLKKIHLQIPTNRPQPVPRLINPNNRRDKNFPKDVNIITIGLLKRVGKAITPQISPSVMSMCKGKTNLLCILDHKVLLCPPSRGKAQRITRPPEMRRQGKGVLGEIPVAFDRDIPLEEAVHLDHEEGEHPGPPGGLFEYPGFPEGALGTWEVAELGWVWCEIGSWGVVIGGASVGGLLKWEIVDLLWYCEGCGWGVWVAAGLVVFERDVRG